MTRRSPGAPVLGALLLVVLAVAVAGCGGGGGGGKSADESLRGIELPDQPTAPNFRLHDQNGRPVTLAAQRGKWVVLTFLYTWCPDVCPVIAGNLNGVLRSPTGKGAKLQVVSVSVDPQRDTPAAVGKYVRNHQLLPAFHWAIGSENELRPVWQAYNVAVLPGAKKTVTHSTINLLIDPTGHERAVYDANVKTADVIADLKTLQGE